MMKVIYTHINTGVKLEELQLIDSCNHVIVKTEDGEQKEMAAITLRRWYKRDLVFVEDVQPEEEKPQDEEPSAVTNTTDLPASVQNVVDVATQSGYEVRIKKTYVAIRANGKSLAEIYFSRKKGTYYMACKEATAINVTHSVNATWEDVPESYGWSLNKKVKFAEFPEDLALNIINSL